MTSFDTLESSRQDSRPLEIYEFSLGSDTYRYTSRASNVVVGANTYTPQAISRSSIEQGSDQKSRNVVITLPGDNVFARRYINVVPGLKATLSIIRLQRDESPTFATQALVFKGQVQSVAFPQDGHNAEIAVRSIESAKNQNIPRFTYMGMCNHFLYDSGCKVDPSSFTHIGTVSSGGATTSVTVVGANGQPDGYWTGGFATATVGEQDFRFILNHVGNVITLLLPFAADVTGLSLQLFAGCDHILTGHCATKFDNVLEFGGFAFVPNKNIFATGLD